MIISLNDIATIQTGIYSHTASNGEIIYLQAKHFSDTGQFLKPVQPDLPSNDQTKKHLLQHGDVLFSAKSSKNFATWYESKNGLVVASSTFLVIRININFKEKVLHEYLTWFLNHPNTQAWLKKKAIGTSILSISKAALQQLKISLPGINVQHSIIKIDQLRNKENNLNKQIQALREQQIQQQIINTLK
ncbi:MAG: restriction endonuclease subunit S [Bacteroidota bacterium]|nr:restriction endonuclease subunit S [Bacteroidota bacterium]